MRALAAVAFLMFVATCQAPPTEMTDAEREAIASEIRAHSRAALEPFAEPQDVEEALSFYVRDASDYFVGDAVVGVFNLSMDEGSEDFREGMRSLVNNRLGTSVEFKDDRIAVLSRDHAVQVLAADYAIKNLEGVTRTGHQMVQTQVWVREDGAGKVLHFHQSFRAPTE
jgi:hypothetical protein